MIANKAKTEPFSLNDLPGSAGRMDIVCRCIAQALLVSHDVRRNVKFYSIFLGEPDPPKAIKIIGKEIKFLGPDERNIAGLIRKALSMKISKEWKKSTPGIYIAKRGLKEILEELKKEYKLVYLREDGKDIRKVINSLERPAFILGDHLGVSGEMEEVILNFTENIISISPVSLQADQCILIVNYELDRVGVM